jgi:hypothetical protein
MTLRAIGHGAGSRDFPERPERRPRESSATAPAAAEPIDIRGTGHPRRRSSPGRRDPAAARVRDRIACAKPGALDVHVAPVQMKKGRAGHLVTILARPSGSMRSRARRSPRRRRSASVTAARAASSSTAASSA